MRHASVAAVALVVMTAGWQVQAAEKIKPVPEARMKEIVREAPKLPVDLDMGLQMRLIDFIDCSDPDDPHDFRDQGTSKVVSGAAGKYRVTAPHRHAFFSYAFRTAGRDKPVLMVIEYPDDAQRIISYMTHDSMRAELPHTSFSQETGVYTGYPLPLSNRMQYFTLVSWPQDDWSPLIALNFAHDGGAGAASRIWVYAIDEMPPLGIDAPDPANQRTLDAFFCLSFLASRDNFGWKSEKSIEHMVDYCNLIGVNRVTMMVYYAPTLWGPGCTIPSWDADDKGGLDDILRQMDAKGGVGMIAGVVADGMYGKVVSGGVQVSTMPAEKAKAIILKGFDDFLDRYGKYKSLKGIALGSMETIGFYDTLYNKGMVDEVVAHIKKRRPDFEVLTYVGNWRLQTPYFGGKQGSPTTGDVISRWETSGKDWSEFLAGEVHENFKRWKHDPAEMKKAGLNVYEMFHPNDHRMHALYTQEPRQSIYYDTFRCQALSDIVDTPQAAIFDTFTEGHIGLHKELNFWHTKLWTGPDFNPPGELAIAPWAQVMAQGDRQTISAGAWSVKYFGLDSQMRRFARAFRSLPPVPMKAGQVAMLVPGGPQPPSDTVKIRWALYKGKRYSYLQSLIPLECKVAFDGRDLTLRPYELKTFVDDKTEAPMLHLKGAPAYRKWVEDRIARFEELYAEVKALDPKAAPEVYLKTAKKARSQLSMGQFYTADITLGHGLVGELQLRKDVLQRPQMKAARIAGAPPMNGDLDAWPKAATDIRAETSDCLLGHVFFVNSWTGPDDLSARVRLAHDGEKLYVGVEVRDSIVARYAESTRQKTTVERSDSCSLRISTDGAYKDWTKPRGLKANIQWPISLPLDGTQTSGTGAAGFSYTCRRTATGYVVEGSAPLAELGVRPGQGMGFLLEVGDADRTPNLSFHSWSRKQLLYVPHKVNFENWTDARNCGELVLE